jgi:hypothetical protein
MNFYQGRADMNKDYILTVDNLDARILHVAIREAYLRGQILRAIQNINSYTILLCTCENYSDIINVISTLETSQNVEVITVEDRDETLMNFRGISDDKSNRKQTFLKQA